MIWYARPFEHALADDEEHLLLRFETVDYPRPDLYDRRPKSDLIRIRAITVAKRRAGQPLREGSEPYES